MDEQSLKEKMIVLVSKYYRNSKNYNVYNITVSDEPHVEGISYKVFSSHRRSRWRVNNGRFIIHVSPKWETYPESIKNIPYKIITHATYLFDKFWDVYYIKQGMGFTLKLEKAIAVEEYCCMYNSLEDAKKLMIDYDLKRFKKLIYIPILKGDRYAEQN